VTSSLDKTARVWDAQSGTLTVTLPHDSRVFEAKFSPDGKQILTIDGNNTARLWDEGYSKVDLTLSDKVSAIYAWSPDGKRILGSSWALFDAHSGRLVARLTGMTGHTSTVGFSPDGKRILIAGWDRLTRVWEAESGRLQSVLAGHSDIVWSSRFAPDGRRILSVGNDEVAKLWDLSSGRLLATFRLDVGQSKHGEFSPDGKHVLITGSSGRAAIYIVDFNELLGWGERLLPDVTEW
jgi:WD40 repeat protein